MKFARPDHIGEQIIDDRFGDDATLADWNALSTRYAEEGGDFLRDAGLVQRDEEGISGGAITRDGDRFWSGDRHYSFTWGDVPATYLSHDSVTYDGVPLHLGSWYNDKQIFANISGLEIPPSADPDESVLSVVEPDDTGKAIASVAVEEFVLGSGAGERISGTPSDLDGDMVTGFDKSDTVTFLDTLFGVSDVTFSSGSVIMDIDTDADGDPDTNLTFAGQDDPESFVFSQEDGSTEIGIGVAEDPDGETITGGAADDTLEGTAGNDTIDGGAGFDTALYSGDQNSYTLTLSPTATTVTDRRADGNGTDTLIDMEFLDFDSGDFDLNQLGGTTGLSEQNFESFIELYIAYFNRAPDAIGLNFWGTAFANGTSLEEMAALFAPQDETLATYPPGTSNEDFATSVYNNVLGRDPDLDGFNFWVGQLDEGNFSRDQFILEVLQGVQTGSPDRDYLDNKVDIGAYFAVHKGMSDTDNAAAVMELFDNSGVDAAVGATDDYYAEALEPNNGEFLMQLVGVLDDPFAVA